jgi:hypothetical protein
LLRQKTKYSKEVKTLQKALAKNQNELELREREADMEREAEQSRERIALIEENKPKAKKTKQAKEAKAIRTAATKEAKAMAKETKDKMKAKAKEAKTNQKKKQKLEIRYRDEESAGEESSSDEEQQREKDAAKKKKTLHWKEWVIMTHELRERDGKPWFWVAMKGYPPEAGEKEKWAERKNLVTDGAKTLIDKYIQERANYQPYSDLLVSKQKGKKVTLPPAQVDRSTPCQHGNFQVSFKMEDHPGFCAPGQYLHSLKCGGVGCDRTFAANLKEVRQLGQDNASRPTSDKPVYCCVNISGRSGAYRKNECRHALCNPCWTKAVLGEGTQAADKRSGQGRRRGRGGEGLNV